MAGYQRPKTNIVGRSFFISLIILFFFFSACNVGVPHEPYRLNDLPEFNADSAYSFVVRQVAFGPRVPNTPAHDSCARFIEEKLRSYGLLVSTERFVALRFDSLPMWGVNIFASLRPELKHRVLLFTHWDTRFIAERDSDSLRRSMPILGANDGGSGTAVLLELARVMSQMPPDVGVDFLFFDLEDQGPAEVHSMIDFYRYWALGARYWSRHKPRGYHPLWGLEVDLVGARGARFSIEDYSLYYYGYLVKRLWEIGQALGYDTLFVDYRSRGLFDDHVIVNEYAGIRSVIIIENIPHHFFGSYWHTHRDSLQIIDANVLKAVGQTVLGAVYNVK